MKKIKWLLPVFVSSWSGFAWGWSPEFRDPPLLKALEEAPAHTKFHSRFSGGSCLDFPPGTFQSPSRIPGEQNGWIGKLPPPPLLPPPPPSSWLSSEPGNLRERKNTPGLWNLWKLLQDSNWEKLDLKRFTLKNKGTKNSLPWGSTRLWHRVWGEELSTFSSQVLSREN